jgi:phenylalanyl-tRNA synthetase alpha chain
MNEEISNIKNEAISQIFKATTPKELEEIKIRYLGRKGKINLLLKNIGKLDINEKKQLGTLINQAKNHIEDACRNQLDQIGKEVTEMVSFFDPTIPGVEKEIGHLHPQTKVLTEILSIFKYLGYKVADGPEIERDYYNFEVLNFPKDHPARDSQQTMFIDVEGTNFNPGDFVPRTHTSSMQGRIMEKTTPPFKVVVPGRCFRYEQLDASHGVEFWQVEGFAIDKDIKFTDLLGTIEFVLKGIFGERARVRFATTFFPFVEPGLDAYIRCSVCEGKGCSFCKKTGWSEIMPAGMIHPNVLKSSGIDPKAWRGFAFAIGLSRVVTLKYKIDDLRVLHTPDLRITKQF